MYGLVRTEVPHVNVCRSDIRGDDLYSLGYMTIRFVQGRVSWQVLITRGSKRGRSIGDGEEVGKNHRRAVSRTNA